MQQETKIYYIIDKEDGMIFHQGNLKKLKEGWWNSLITTFVGGCKLISEEDYKKEINELKKYLKEVLRNETNIRT